LREDRLREENRTEGERTGGFEGWGNGVKWLMGEEIEGSEIFFWSCDRVKWLLSGAVIALLKMLLRCELSDG
jgi:hypothetical protein